MFDTERSNERINCYKSSVPDKIASNANVLLLTDIQSRAVKMSEAVFLLSLDCLSHHEKKNRGLWLHYKYFDNKGILFPGVLEGVLLTIENRTCF